MWTQQHHRHSYSPRPCHRDGPDRGPLLRLAIATLTDDQVLLVWTSHHVTLDGWSLAQVFTEVCKQYAAIVARPDTAELVTRRPFRDYLQWLATRISTRPRSYWRRDAVGL